MANKLKFCQNCGNKIVKKERFCRYCGYNFGMAQNPQGTRAGRRRSKKPAIITITSLVLVGSLAITGFWYPGFIKNYFLTLEPSVKMQEAKEASVKIPVNTNGKGTTVGSVEESGYSIHVDDGAFPKDGTLTVTPFDQKKLSNIKNKSAYEFLSTPVEINCDAYSGGFFAEDVVYTVPLPKDAKDLGRYVFGCIDEETGEVRYLEPDSYDLENGTMSVVLPHFSSWFAAKITKEEEKERFLDKYSMQLAIQESEQKRAAAELEPYVKAKVKALGLTEQATADLVQSTLNYMSGCFKDAEGNKIDWKETAGKAITSVARGVYEKDPETIQSGLEDTLNGALMHAWDDNKFNDKLDKVLGSEFAGGAVGTLLSSSNGVARMAGRLMEGDVKGAAEELGGVMQNVHPSVELCTKSANLLLALGNTSMVNWKSNMVDEMYNIYKNGAEGLFGIEVEPQNKESFLAYFNNEYGGISAYRCVSRFYNLDKIAEVCERYGWEEKTYNELSEEKKAIFNKRAQDSLMEYFELRLKQEKRAAEIKEQESRNIETMLNPFYGVLYSGNFREFFGESSYRDYSLTHRLERLVNVRRFISQYVDMNRLQWLSKDPECTNMGNLLNEWIKLASDKPKKEAIDEFIKYLKENELLNKDFEDDESADTTEAPDKAESTDSTDKEAEINKKALLELRGKWENIRSNEDDPLVVLIINPGELSSFSGDKGYVLGSYMNDADEYVYDYVTYDRKTGVLTFSNKKGTKIDYTLTLQIIDSETIRIAETGVVLYRVYKMDLPDAGESSSETENEYGLDAFMGEWYDADNKRTILYRNGDNVIVKQPDLAWYGGDVCCTEYTAELDEKTLTLTLKGVTTWVSSSLDSDERQLEMDATSSSLSFTATEYSNGEIMAVQSSGKTLTR